MKRISSLLSVAAVVVGCGAPNQPVPDVVGERLDVAASEVSDAGYDTEALGGGTFGIVDESNWTVCETRPAAGTTGGGTVKLVVARSCEEPEVQAAVLEEAEPSTREAVATPKAKKAKKRKRPKAVAPSSGRITVPDVVGIDHQLAQDTMQAAGLYMLAEEDATGRGRMLLYDRNWTVVRQSPAPGARVSENRTITLFSVKDDE